jgi:hypothetical protein
MSLLIKKYEDQNATSWKVYSILGNLDDNVAYWDEEEFAIAGILVDLHDGKNALDSDNIELSLPEIWDKSKGWKNSQFGNGHIFDLKDLYEAYQMLRR